jgi:hypothetical protein
MNGEALVTFANGVWKAIPDFSIELLNSGEIEPGLVDTNLFLGLDMDMRVDIDTSFSFGREKAPDDHPIADLQFPPVASVAVNFCSLSGHGRKL